jgi:hypothetical protein
MSKRLFWSMFQTSWETAFTEKNIASAWRATGIFPYKPNKVLKIIKPIPTTPEKSPASLPMKMPLSEHAMRKAYRLLKTKSNVTAIEKIVRGSEQLAAKNDCLQHEIRGLREVLVLEKKKRNRGKRLNLLGEEDNGPQLFNPARIALAQAHAEEKEEAERQKKKAIESRKVKANALRLEKVREKEKRIAARVVKQQLKQAEKVHIEKERAAKKELREQAKIEKELKKAELAATQRK